MFAIHVYLKGKQAQDSDPVDIELVIYGEDEADADKKRIAFMSECAAYALADTTERAIEVTEDDIDVPSWEELEEDDDDADEDDDPNVIDVDGEEVER